MIVGKAKSSKLGKFYRERSKKSIDYALQKIKESPIAPYVEYVYLYGSCARCEQTHNSDVDLFVQLKSGMDITDIKSEIINLTGRVIPPDPDLPEVDLKVVIGTEWKNNKDLYYKNVLKDGVELCFK